MKRKILVVLLALMMLLVVGCSQQPSDQGSVDQPGETASSDKTEVVCALASVPNNLDISTSMGISLLTITPHVCDTLLSLDENYNMGPGIATSWEKVDDTTWTFEIGEGFIFSNGEELEMDDIVYSYERCRDIPAMASYMSNIESVTYEGRTVTIKLVEPNNLTIINLCPTLVPILNKSYCEEKGEEAILNMECGTGPYKVTEYIPGDKVVLERRDDYPFEKPAIQKITFKQILEPANRYIALETGEVQFASELAYKDYQRALENDSLAASAQPASGLTFLTLNTQAAPFDNANVRLAMAYAMDRESWCAITEGVEPLMTMISAAYPDCAEDPGMPEFNLEKAKELLEAEGYNAENPLQFEIQTYLSSPALEAYQATLKSIGVDASIKMYEKGTVISMLRSGECSMTLLTLYSASGTPLFEAGCYKTGDMRNFALLEDEEMNDYICKALAASTEEEMVEYINKASAASVQYIPYIPVCNQNLYCAADSSLEGVTVRADSLTNFLNASYK